MQCLTSFFLRVLVLRSILSCVRGAPDHLCSTAADPGTDRCDVPVPQDMEETVRFHRSAYNDALSKRLWVCSCCWRFWQPVGLCLAGEETGRSPRRAQRAARPALGHRGCRSDRCAQSFSRHDVPLSLLSRDAQNMVAKQLVGA